jgi:hypothetical protein
MTNTGTSDRYADLATPIHLGCFSQLCRYAPHELHHQKDEKGIAEKARDEQRLEGHQPSPTLRLPFIFTLSLFVSADRQPGFSAQVERNPFQRRTGQAVADLRPHRGASPGLYLYRLVAHFANEGTILLAKAFHVLSPILCDC